MDKVKTITLAVIAVALLLIGYSLFQISQNGRYQSVQVSEKDWEILDKRTGKLYDYSSTSFTQKDFVNRKYSRYRRDNPDVDVDKW